MKKKMERFMCWGLVFVITLSILHTDVWTAEIIGNESENMSENPELSKEQELSENPKLEESLQYSQETEVVEMETTAENDGITEDTMEEQEQETLVVDPEGETEEETQTIQQEISVDNDAAAEVSTEVEDTAEDNTTTEDTIEAKQESKDMLDTISANQGNVSFVQEYAKVGSELTVNYFGEQKDVSYIWYVDEKKIDCVANSYIPTQSDIEKIIKVEVCQDNTKLGEASMLCSRLPVIYIDTENAQPIVSKENYILAHLKIQGNDEYNLGTTTLYDGEINIRGRGNSTWSRFDKKPYKVKLDKSTSLFGMGKNKHWALIANYIDGSLMRNQLSVNISKQIGVEAMDAVWVDVVLNGVCVGNYQLYEQVRVSKERVNVFDWDGAAGDIAKAIVKKEKLSDEDKDVLTDYMEKNMQWMTSHTVTYNGVTYNISDYYDELPESTSGGYLMELTTDADEVSLFNTTRGVPIQFKNPEYINTNETAFNGIKNYVQQLEDAIYSADHCTLDGDSHVSYLDYCDSKSLMTYWLSCEMLRNEIGYKSNYFYKADNMPVVFGPVWDFDFSAGSVAPFGAQSAKGWSSSGRAWFSECMKDPYFAVKVRELYNANIEYLQGIVSNGGLLDQWYEYLKESGEKNFEIWHYSRTIEEDYTILKSWLANRMNWMAQQFKTDETTFASLGVPLSTRFALSLTGEDILSNEGRNYWGAYKEGQTFALDLKVIDGNYSKFNYYVNGRYIAEGDITNNEAGVTISDDMLTEGLDNKNVISVWLKDGNGSLTEMQCVTLNVASGTKNYYNVTFHDQLEEQANVYAQKKVEGGRILLSDTSLNVEKALFEGWSDGVNVYPKNSYFKVDQDIDLYAVWAICTNGSYCHNWTEEGNVYICVDCGKQKTIQRNDIDIAECFFDQSNRYNNVYTGSHVAPVITVKYGKKTLTEGEEYNISFKNDVNVGYATYEITGIEKAGFTGKVALSYRIIPASIAAADIIISDIETQTYTGKEIKPSVKITHNDKTLNLGTDYKLTYSKNKAVGRASITIEGIGNYKSKKTKTFAIIPQKVTNLKAVVSGKNNIKLSWNKLSNVTGYRVYRSIDGKNFDYIKTLKGNSALTYMDKNLAPEKKYYYQVRGYVDDVTLNKRFYGELSNTASAFVLYVYQKVTNVKAAASNYNSIKLSWNKTSGVTGYRIYRSTDGKNFSYIKTLKGNQIITYVDKNLTTGKTYYYKVRGYIDDATLNKRFYGELSNAVSVRPVPGKVTIQFIANATGKKVTLSWGKVTGATGYVIYQATTKNGTYSAIKTVTNGSVGSYTKSGLVKGKTYYYKIRAYRTVNGQKIYGTYSDIKSISIRK